MGIGLGLHICKQLITKIEGNTTVESMVNLGTFFTFSFLQKLNDHLTQEEEEEKFIIPINNFTDSISIINNSFRIESNDVIDDFPTRPCLRTLMDVKNMKFCLCSKLLIVDDDSNIRNVLKAYEEDLTLYMKNVKMY